MNKYEKLGWTNIGYDECGQLIGNNKNLGIVGGLILSHEK